MLSALNLQTLMFIMALVGIVSLLCLLVFGKVQKTYAGYGYWLSAYACSVTMLVLFGLRGTISDFWSIIVANMAGAMAPYLLFLGFLRFNGSFENSIRYAWPAVLSSAMIIYLTLFQNDVLARTLVMAGCVLLYSLWMARVCWFFRGQKPRVACRLFTMLFLFFSLISLIRAAIWVISPAERSLFQPSTINNIYLLCYFIMLIGTAFLIMLMTSLRIASELKEEKESVVRAQQELIESQQQLRRTIRFSPFPLMVHAEDGEVLQVSEAWTEISGYELADIPTIQDWLEKAYGERQTEILAIIKKIYDIQTQYDDGEYVITTRSGEQRVWQFRTAPLGRYEGKRLVISMAVDVTERKQADAALQELNRQLEARVAERTAELEDLYNNAPCGYHSLDSDGVYLRINDTELKWLGLSRDEVVGKRKLFDFISPEYMTKARKEFAKLLSQGFNQDVRYELRGVDGACRQVVGAASAIFDAAGNFVCSRSTLFDVSEQYQMNEMLKAFLDEASDPVHITDQQGRFIYVNRAWLELFGYSREEATRLSIYDVTSANEHARWEWLLNARTETETRERSEYIFIDKTGNSLFIETVILARYEHGEFAGTQAILIDVTARRKMENELKEERWKLKLVNQELERLAGLKDDFLASMSHELRTPLTAVIGLSEILRDGAYGELAPEQAEAIASIEKSGRHLLELINDILDLSKLEAKQAVLELEDCSASDIGQASLQFVKNMAAKKGISVDFSIRPEMIKLQADPRRLKQMLINLLSNAVKFTPEGGKVGLLIKADPGLQRVLLTVWDTGIGIRSEDMGKLFQPFVQIDNSLGRHYAGTGLGLVLVQKAAQMHGGQVLVESTVGVGSRFTIELPWQPGEDFPEDNPSKTRPVETLVRIEAENLQSPVVLLADDNPDNARVVVAALRNKPWQVIFAEDGLKAVEQASFHKPALILMDVQMPGMDGLAAIRKIRSDPDPAVSKIPIIALTALAMKGDRERCLQAGADDYVAKPIDFSELIRKMTEQVQRANAKLEVRQ